MRTILATALFICLSRALMGQVTTLVDFTGEDYSFAPREIVTTPDWIYGITFNGGNNDKGTLYRVRHNGEDFTILHHFGDQSAYPESLIKSDGYLYGTTAHGGSQGGSTIFQYSLSSGELTFIKQFSNEEGFSARLRSCQDGLLYGITGSSFSDEGSIFSISIDGSGFVKLFNDTNLTTGQNPTDFYLAGDQLIIAFYNGGGIPYDDGVGGKVYSGSLAKVNLNDNTIITILQGAEGVGTQPSSFYRVGDKLYCFFDYSGREYACKIYSMDLDGSDISLVASIQGVGRGYLSYQGKFLYGITANSLFRINTTNNDLEIIQEFSVNTGRDATAGPVPLGAYAYVGTQAGGTDGGGNILKIKTNTAPAITRFVGELETKSDSLFVFSLSNVEISDQEQNYPEDFTFTLLAGENYSIVGDTIFPSAGFQGILSVPVVVNDGYESSELAYANINVISPTITGVTGNTNVAEVNLSPNPSKDKVRIDFENLSSKELQAYLYNTQGVCVMEVKVTSSNSNISVADLPNGIYIVKILGKGEIQYQGKLIKY